MDGEDVFDGMRARLFAAVERVPRVMRRRSGFAVRASAVIKLMQTLSSGGHDRAAQNRRVAQAGAGAHYERVRALVARRLT